MSFELFFDFIGLHLGDSPSNPANIVDVTEVTGNAAGAVAAHVLSGKTISSSACCFVFLLKQASGQVGTGNSVSEVASGGTAAPVTS